VQPTDTKASLWAVSFVDSRTGFAVGQQNIVLGTTNGGISWRILHDADRTLGGLHGVAFTDANRGTAVSNRGIWRTTDGGATWHSQWGTGMSGVAFLDANTAIAVGFGGAILRTATAGE
jgi:photosystem II stability/assembly factor-like uncharacterized protein